jgi:hypothetical protein
MARKVEVVLYYVATHDPLDRSGTNRLLGYLIESGVEFRCVAKTHEVAEIFVQSPDQEMVASYTARYLSDPQMRGNLEKQIGEILKFQATQKEDRLSQ